MSAPDTARQRARGYLGLDDPEGYYTTADEIGDAAADDVQIARDLLAALDRVDALEVELRVEATENEELHGRVDALTEALRENIGDAYNLLTQGESPTQLLALVERQAADLERLRHVEEAARAYLAVPRKIEKDADGIFRADFTPQQEARKALAEAVAAVGAGEATGEETPANG